MLTTHAMCHDANPEGLVQPHTTKRPLKTRVQVLGLHQTPLQGVSGPELSTVQQSLQSDPKQGRAACAGMAGTSHAHHCCMPPTISNSMRRCSSASPAYLPRQSVPLRANSATGFAAPRAPLPLLLPPLLSGRAAAAAHSAASARTSAVFPVPGGPCSRIPLQHSAAAGTAWVNTYASMKHAGCWQACILHPPPTCHVAVWADSCSRGRQGWANMAHKSSCPCPPHWRQPPLRPCPLTLVGGCPGSCTGQGT